MHALKNVPIVAAQGSFPVGLAPFQVFASFSPLAGLLGPKAPLVNSAAASKALRGGHAGASSDAIEQAKLDPHLEESINLSVVTGKLRTYITFLLRIFLRYLQAARTPS